MAKPSRAVGTIPSISCLSCRKGQVNFRKFGSMIFGSCEKCKRTYAKVLDGSSNPR